MSGSGQSPAQGAGYSGKVPWQKLGLMPDRRLQVRHAPGDRAALVGAEPAGLDLVGSRTAFDIAHVFADRATTLARELAALSARLRAA